MTDKLAEEILRNVFKDSLALKVAAPKVLFADCVTA